MLRHTVTKLAQTARGAPQELCCPDSASAAELTLSTLRRPVTGASAALSSTHVKATGKRQPCHPSLQDWGEKELLKQWDNERNKEELGLTPADVTLGSSVKAFWNCSGCPGCGQVHDWQAGV